MEMESRLDADKEHIWRRGSMMVERICGGGVDSGV